MKHSPILLTCREIELAELDTIQPLWEKLKVHHVSLSPALAGRRAARTFEARKQELLAKGASGLVHIEVAYAGAEPVAYCIASLSCTGSGEIDSLYVEREYRLQGIGRALTQGAVTWLDSHNAVSKLVVVASGNESAIEFYARFGFVADTISLRQIPGAGGDTVVAT